MLIDIISTLSPLKWADLGFEDPNPTLIYKIVCFAYYLRCSWDWSLIQGPDDHIKNIFLLQYRESLVYH